MNKTREKSLTTTRRVVYHEHLNPNGILFGGYLMCWIDEIAFLCASRYTGKKSCVTVNIDNISFKYPLKLGEQIFLSAQVNHAGKTSMEIEVRVEKENTESGERILTNHAFLTFVCLDENYKPTRVPELHLETQEDERVFWQARLRTRVRKRLAAYMERRLKEENFVPRKEAVRPMMSTRSLAKKLRRELQVRVKNKIIHLLEA
jgi:acyl-CoA hydrolase